MTNAFRMFDISGNRNQPINLIQTERDSSNPKENGLIFLNELKTIDKWKQERILGSGSFAIITLWVNTETDEKIALKQNRNNFIGLDDKKIAYYRGRWMQEISLMHQLKCSNIVEALKLPKEFDSINRFRSPILAMEYCKGGDLRKVLNRPENSCGLIEKEVRQILKQIASALIYLHDLKIVHRDLKPENIVLQPISKGKILYKLTDLGYAKQLSDNTSANSFVGTLEYLAPELFKGKQYTSTVDNWSFGLLAFEIITGRRPFLPNRTIIQNLKIIKQKKSADICTVIDERGDYYFSQEIPSLNRISDSLKSDLEKWLQIVLEYDPKKRGGSRAFEMIKTIMKKSHIRIFSIESYEIFAYEIETSTKLNDLKEKIFSHTNVAIQDQYLFFENGEKPRPKVGEQIIERWYRPEICFEQYNPIVLFMFDRSKLLRYQEFYRHLILPEAVEKMMLNTHNDDDDPNNQELRQSTDLDQLRFTWRCTVFVAQQTFEKYSLVHRMLKSIILNCVILFNQLKMENLELFHSMRMIFEPIKIIRSIFLEPTSDTESSKLSNGSFSLSSSSLSLSFTIIKSLNERVWKHFEQSETIVPRLDRKTFLFEKLFHSSEIDPELLEIFNNLLSQYENLQKQKRENFGKQYSQSKNLMLKSLCECFRFVEDNLAHYIKILSILIEFIGNIERLRSNSNQLRNEFDQFTRIHCDPIYKKLLRCESQSKTSTSFSSDFDSFMRNIEKLEQKWAGRKFNSNTLELNDFLFG
ncbi:inhibitor of nuclear factor kappa-B kinase subunit alpha-like protein [Sarcoptes scabiei]|uniref:IkappaB kinase n=1 Tax=Sarcoptes scabiei TaxID=52283 RepID=A0A132A435_SARSC|nr:inhibitor of nuclear factor kappa-B kinase subunit alpha-like protein [Sarcoptes scabiei]